jgi:hypothetical protein
MKYEWPQGPPVKWAFASSGLVFNFLVDQQLTSGQWTTGGAEKFGTFSWFIIVFDLKEDICTGIYLLLLLFIFRQPGSRSPKQGPQPYLHLQHALTNNHRLAPKQQAHHPIRCICESNAPGTMNTGTIQLINE